MSTFGMIGAVLLVAVSLYAVLQPLLANKRKLTRRQTVEKQREALLRFYEQVIASLRDLLPTLRDIGEKGKGLKLTRFKGLGEMDPDELWETAMDSSRRVLLQVTMEDATAADEIFRVLMGDHVEPRREFIEKHALDVRDLDV